MHFLLLVLSLNLALVLHELGHLVAARVLRLRVREVSLGLGPALWSTRRFGPRLSVGSLLLGARVEVEGDNPFRQADTAAPSAARSLHRRPRARLLLALAGPVGSALFAWLLLILLHLLGTHVPVPLTVGKVLHGSVAASAGVRPGDRIEAVEGVPLERWGQLTQAIFEQPHPTVTLNVRRDDAVVELLLRVPTEGRNPGEATLGWTQQYAYQRSGPLAAMGAAFAHAGHQLRAVADTAGGLLRTPDEAGLQPVMGVRRMVDRGTVSFDAFLRAASLWCLLLMVFHLIPLPPLDAGEGLLALIQDRRGRPLPAGVEVGLAVAGFLVLLTLGAVWTYQRLADAGRPVDIDRPDPTPTSEGVLEPPAASEAEPTETDPASPPDASDAKASPAPSPAPDATDVVPGSPDASSATGHAPPASPPDAAATRKPR